jgi:hypothetical protein
MSRARLGWVPERSIGHAWKACVPQGTEGSNPSPSGIARFFRLRKGTHPRPSFAQTLCWRAEIALHVFRLIKYVAVHEMATVFMVPRASSRGLGTRSDLVYESGGCWAGRRRTEGTFLRRPVTTFEDVGIDAGDLPKVGAWSGSDSTSSAVK